METKYGSINPCWAASRKRPRASSCRAAGAMKRAALVTVASALAIYMVTAFSAASLGTGDLATEADVLDTARSDKSLERHVLLDLGPHLPSFDNVAMVGHLNPDVDSVAGAIAAAALFGGVPTAPGPINRETEYALRRFGVPTPLQTDDPSLANRSWFLVDHGSSRLNYLDQERVVALVDHHRLAEDEVSISRPIYVDIRPWGSMNTVLSFMFAEYQVPLSARVAGVMLCAIISDTLNLRSPTTTEYDIKAYHQLGSVLGFSRQAQFNDLARGLFGAKSNVTGLSARDIVGLDFKTYSTGSLTFGWGSGETTNPALYLASGARGAFLNATTQLEQSKQLDFVFFSVTDISPELPKPQSVVFLNGPEERAMAAQAFPLAMAYEGDDRLLAVGALMSRKADFIPALVRAMSELHSNSSVE